MTDQARRWEGECPWKRVVLKLSGEALADPMGENISGEVLQNLATEIASVREAHDVDIAIVVGGGNIWRGMSGSDGGMDRAQSDHMGMLATVINAIALQDALERAEVPTRVMTAIGMAQVAEPYIRRRAVRHLEKGRVVIFAAGTGNPFFTTDTAAVLRASEVGAEIVIKATKTNGVYDKDPMVHEDAVLFDKLNYDDVLNKNLQVMDATAIAFCRDNRLPIIVIDYRGSDGLLNAVCGKKTGTLIN